MVEILDLDYLSAFSLLAGEVPKGRGGGRGFYEPHLLLFIHVVRPERAASLSPGQATAGSDTLGVMRFYLSAP